MCSHLCACCLGFSLAHSKQKEIGKFETPFPAFFVSFFELGKALAKHSTTKLELLLSFPKPILRESWSNFRCQNTRFHYQLLQSDLLIPQIGGHVFSPKKGHLWVQRGHFGTYSPKLKPGLYLGYLIQIQRLDFRCATFKSLT